MACNDASRGLDRPLRGVDEMNESFVFYESFVDAIETLPAEDQLKAYRAISRYATKGEEPTPALGVAYAIFLMAKPQLDANSNRRINGAKGGRPRKETDGFTDEKPMVNESENHRLLDEKPNVNVNVNENVNVKEKSTEKKSVRFSPPTLEDVSEYCRERGNKVDPHQFIDFYASKGWKVGNQGMKDWKAAVRTWEKRETARSGTPKKNQFNNFTQNQYDFESLERSLLI